MTTAGGPTFEEGTVGRHHSSHRRKSNGYPTALGESEGEENRLELAQRIDPIPHACESQSFKTSSDVSQK